MKKSIVFLLLLAVIGGSIYYYKDKIMADFNSTSGKNALTDTKPETRPDAVSPEKLEDTIKKATEPSKSTEKTEKPEEAQKANGKVYKEVQKQKVKVCKACQKGKVKCSECSGTGEAGYIRCPSCNAKVYSTGDKDGVPLFRCSKCKLDISDIPKCEKCQGDGVVNCKQCNGKGAYISYETVWEWVDVDKDVNNNLEVNKDKVKGTVMKCKSCDGAGSKICRDCDGEGLAKTIKCPTCGHKIDCRSDASSIRKYYCDTCKVEIADAGMCETCNGKGKVVCKVCKGLGVYQAK
jgi:hypothetical protein